MTEFQELVKDAPKFVSMERGELVAYAYAMYASGAKMDAENAKLRKLAREMYPQAKAHLQLGVTLGFNDALSYDWALQMTELGIEVPE